MNTIKESQSYQKGMLVSQLELQKNQQELCNTKSNTKFNIKVTMIIKSRSETASVSRKYKDNCFSDNFIMHIVH